MPAPPSSADYPNLRLVEHPLIAHKLARVRDRSTPPSEFRRLVREIGGLMTFALCAELPVERVALNTPLEATHGARLARPVTLVPILRAGLGLCDGIAALLPEARIGHIGLRRDERTLEAVAYSLSLPADVSAGPALIIDPMVATGGSADHAARALKERGCRDIKLACLVCAPPGVERLLEHHPDVRLFACALDRQLGARGYILPGLGDAGDRLFGTG